jgi:hypothetical protein
MNPHRELLIIVTRASVLDCRCAIAPVAAADIDAFPARFNNHCRIAGTHLRSRMGVCEQERKYYANPDHAIHKNSCGITFHFFTSILHSVYQTDWK